jgi:transposase
MFAPSAGFRFWLYRRPADMRKSFDGLAALVRHALGENPLDGALYTFVNRRRTLMKVIYFERDGYCVWSKRLERGRFQVHWEAPEKLALDRSAWQFIVEGIDLRSVRRLKRYRHLTEGDRPLIKRPV